MQKAQKGLRIEGYVFSEKGDIDPEEFADAFVDFLESKGWEFGGGINQIQDGEK